MNRILKSVLLGILLTTGLARTIAGPTNTTYYTNYWVQPVNFALTAYVQSGLDVISGTLPTKQFLSFLSGLTNSNLILGTNYQVTGEVTNSSFLPANQFPPTFTVTDDYVLTNSDGTTYTNNSSFTQAITFTETVTSPVTYVFSNLVNVASNVTAYVFPALAAGQLTAVLVTTNGPGTVFALTGTGTNGTTLYGTNANFAQFPGTKLLYRTPMVVTVTSWTTNAGTKSVTSSITNASLLSSEFLARYTSGKTQVDTPLDGFFKERPYISVAPAVPGIITGKLVFAEIDFSTVPSGTYFNFVGFDTQTWGILTAKHKPGAVNFENQRRIIASNYGGQISGTVQSRTFTSATTLVTGTITISRGTME